jgi:hypothetical protein
MDKEVDENFAEGQVIPFRRPQAQPSLPADILHLANEWFHANDDTNTLQAVTDPGYGQGADNLVKYIQAKLQSRGWTIDFDDEIDNIVLTNRSGQTVALPVADAYDETGWAKGTMTENLQKGQTLTRIDSQPIEDFGSNMPTYYHTKDWSQSGQFAPGSKIPKKFSGKVQGTFAGDPHRTALYATGNAGETRFVEITDLNGQSYVYFDKKDLPKIRARKTYLTVFPADGFRATNPDTGEYFSSSPGKPIEQKPITDPFQYITSQGWIVRTTDDLNKILVQAKKLHDQGKIKSYGGEGMGVQENFADGRGPGRPGDSQRHGIPKGATMAELERASHATGRKGELARWQLNMRRGQKRKHKE